VANPDLEVMSCKRVQNDFGFSPSRNQTVNHPPVSKRATAADTKNARSNTYNPHTPSGCGA